jgi:GNAT superfamily N-acetyltransferase
MKIVKKAISRCKRVLTAIHTLTFPADDVPRWKAEGVAWVAYDGDEDDAVAFLYAEPTLDGSWYFSRVGVLPAARGKGLQREFMRRLEGWAKREGITTLVSTTYLNPASANNFVREQWMTYLPAFPWGAADTIYWRKDLR